MKRRKLIGATNITIRANTFMEGTEVEQKGYMDIYAVDTGGVLTTLKERFIEGKFYDSYETKEDPYKVSYEFKENGEWEEIE